MALGGGSGALREAGPPLVGRLLILSVLARGVKPFARGKRETAEN